MKKILFVLFLFTFQGLSAQQNVEKFKSAFKSFAADADFAHGTIGFKVLNAKSGQVILDYHSDVGLPAASTQKIITAASAYKLLGEDFYYETKIEYTGEIVDGTLKGNIIIRGSGDPTLGSWRYAGTKEESVINGIVAAIRQAGIRELDGHVLIDESLFDDEAIPDGWIWQDIGNYYGAGAHAINWRENQYDLYLRSGNTVGSPVEITGTKPGFIPELDLQSKLRAAAAGTGDNAYIYFPDYGKTSYVRGSIPVNQRQFTISGTIPYPGRLLAVSVEAILKKQSPAGVNQDYPEKPMDVIPGMKELLVLRSPALDSINYWFLQKSINLYGEALLKTLGQRFGKNGSTEEGLRVVKNFWAGEGIDKYALGMIDGSGLSPQNRITANVLVKVLMYARSQPWFDSYFAGFPVIHGIKMKSGTIGGGVAYTGIIPGKTGDYVFAVIVNNYRGSASQTRSRIWRVLDQLK